VCTQLAQYVLSARAHAAPVPAEPATARALAGRVRDSLFWLLSPYL
jgi:hypothetical protein